MRAQFLKFARGRSLLAALPLVLACTDLLPGGETLRSIDGGDDAGSDASLRDADTDSDGGDQGDAGDDEGGAPQADAGPGDGGTPECPAINKRGKSVRAGEIKNDERWTCDKTYEIDGNLVISSGTLFIDAGVRVLARNGAAILVSRAARLEAVGTAGQPIVFGPATHPAQPARWRGIILLGGAPTALPGDRALALSAGDPRGYFGGTDTTHDCGTLRYVRVEFAGGSTNETDLPLGAALLMAGCGSETEVDHLQVHAGTDGIGLIGGSVPLKRVLVSAPNADGIEWAAGYQGLIQFAIVQSFYGTGAALKGSRLEIDEVTTPPSYPIIFNASLIGANAQGMPSAPSDPGGFENAIQLQAGTRAIVRNSLVLGFYGAWVDVIGAGAAAQVGVDTHISHTIFADPQTRTNPGFPGDQAEFGDDENDDVGFSEDATFRALPLKNRFPPGATFSLRAPFVAPPARPDFTADAFVDQGALYSEAVTNWEGVLEKTAFAGALPRKADRLTDWTWESTVETEAWTSFPQD